MGLSSDERRIVRALGQSLFPRDRTVDLDGDDVGFTDWVEDYLDRMPPGARGQIRALFRTFDLGYGVWAGTPGARFCNARLDRRQAYAASWADSTTYTQRMLFEALWAVAAFGYVESAEAMGAVGRGPGDARALEADQALRAEVAK